MEKITILLADDHKLLRDSWTVMLNSDERFHVVAAASSGEEAIDMVQEFQPDIVLMDINMGDISGFEASERILSLLPAQRIIGVSMHSLPAYAKKFFKIGVKGYVTKNSSRDEFIRAILTVRDGKNYVCDEIKEAISRKEFSFEPEPDIESLSIREIEIVKMIKEGLSSRQISENLGLSLKTIEVHRYNILKKLNLKNSAVLVDFVNHHGF